MWSEYENEVIFMWLLLLIPIAVLLLGIYAMFRVSGKVDEQTERGSGCEAEEDR